MQVTPRQGFSVVVRLAAVAALFLPSAARADEAPPPVAPMAPSAPVPAPVAPPSAAAADAPALRPPTLARIEAAYDDLEKAAVREVTRRRYDAVLAYVGAQPQAADLEPARTALVQLAMGIDAWDAAVTHAEAYLAAHPNGPHEIEARFAKADALARLEHGTEARAAYDALTRALSVSKHGKNTVMAAWSYWAQWLTESGDLEGAKNAWRGLKGVLGSTPDAVPIVRMADGELAALEQIGKEARALPPDTKDLDGRPLSLAELKGQVVLLDFWATWCGPCVKELPALLDAYERFHAKGFEIVGVSIDGLNSEARVREFLAAQGVPWRTIYDPSGRNPVQQTYGVSGIPHTVLVGRDGRVVKIGLRGKDLAKALSKLLGG